MLKCFENFTMLIIYKRLIEVFGINVSGLYDYLKIKIVNAQIFSM